MEGNHVEKGVLYIVATPIGNMADITFRAVDVLRHVDVIACEDTRVTGKLCAHYHIDVPRTAIHHHTHESKLQDMVARIKAGESVAYVSDAGTPGVSDPGNQLVEVAIAADVRVVPIPGVSAVATILSVAGCDTQKFAFFAYPPHKKGRQTFFEQVAASQVSVVYYDSVHRVIKNLGLLAQHKPEARVVVGRELTKMFEEIKRGRVEDIIEYFVTHPQKVKGEFAIIVL